MESSEELIGAFARQYLQGVEKGYGKNITEVDFNSTDGKCIEKMTENVYEFSAAKNWHELRDMTDALHDGDRVRTFSEFKAEVDEITDKYNENWLRTEYNQAIAASQSGARWNEFSENKEAMPFLEYQAVMDENTREDHAALNGVIKPIDDPFWNTYYPPNGWGCRCEAIQLTGHNHQPTPDSQIVPPAVPELFRTNFGKEGIVFPPEHPYFKKLPEEYENEAKIYSREKVRTILDNAETYKELSKDKNYLDVKFDYTNGGLIATHVDHNFDPHLGHCEKEVQNILYKNGHSMILTSEQSDILAKRHIDGLFDGITQDISTCCGIGKNNIKHCLQHAESKDADCSIIYFQDNNINLYSEKRIKDGINDYYEHSNHHLKVICIIGGTDSKIVEY